MPSAAAPPSDLSRRGFLRTAGKGGAELVAAGLAPLAVAGTPEYTTLAAALEGHQPVECGPVDCGLLALCGAICHGNQWWYGSPARILWAR